VPTLTQELSAAGARDVSHTDIGSATSECSNSWKLPRRIVETFFPVVTSRVIVSCFEMSGSGMLRTDAITLRKILSDSSKRRRASATVGSESLSKAILTSLTR